MAKKSKSKGMPQSEIAAMVGSYLEGALGFRNGELSQVRAKNIDYYLGQPFGKKSAANQETATQAINRSQVITTEVRDAVEWRVAQIIKPFVSSENSIMFSPREPGDELIAQEQTDAARFDFFQRNNGFLCIHNWIKDAEIEKLGVLKSEWVEKETIEIDTKENLSELEYLEIATQKDIEIVAQSVTDGYEDNESNDISLNLGTDPGKRYSIKTRKKTKICEIKYDVIPSDSFFVSPSQRDLDLSSCVFCGDETLVTQTDLLEMGFSLDEVQDLYSDQTWFRSPEKLSRYNFTDESRYLMGASDNGMNKAMRTISLYTCYVRFDSDGDGKAEHHRILYANSRVLEDKVIPDWDSPYSLYTPCIVPHKFIGLCTADEVIMPQEIITALTRQIMDNVYYVNNQRLIVNENGVNMKDVMNVQPGSPIRCKGDLNNAVLPLIIPPVGDAAYQMIQRMEQIIQARTGLSAGGQGLDEDLLNNNKGDVTIQRIMNNAEERTAMSIRVLAETGMKHLFRRIIKLMIYYQGEAKMIRLSPDKFVNIDPSKWKGEMDVTLNVGLGSGDDNKKQAALAQILANQNLLVQSGAFGTLLNQQNIYKALVDSAKTAGIKHPEMYYQDPDSEDAKLFAEQAAQAKKSGQAQDPQQQLLMLQQQVESQNLLIKQQELELKKIQEAHKEKIDLATLQLKNRDQELNMIKAANDMHNSIEQNHQSVLKHHLERDKSVMDLGKHISAQTMKQEENYARRSEKGINTGREEDSSQQV